jgi:hypothetical protein
MYREAYTDKLGHEGLRWSANNDRHVFIPSVSHSRPDKQVRLQDATGNYSVVLFAHEDGSINAVSFDRSTPVFVGIRLLGGDLSNFGFYRMIRYNRDGIILNIGYSVGPDMTIEPSAYTQGNSHIDVATLPDFYFSYYPTSGEHALTFNSPPGTPVLTVQRRPLEWRFGQPGAMYSANIHTALGDIRNAAQMLSNGISTQTEASEMIHSLSCLQRDIFLPVTPPPTFA